MSKQLLVDAVRSDGRRISEVLVSYPDDWTLAGRIDHDGQTLYVGAFPASEERPRADHFFGLGEDVNLALDHHRMYKVFRRWGEEMTVRLQSVGQAQVWFGDGIAMIWEAYLMEHGRTGNWQEAMKALWRLVEEDLGVETLYAHASEPTWDIGDYHKFLNGLGYERPEEFLNYFIKRDGEAQEVPTVPTNGQFLALKCLRSKKQLVGETVQARGFAPLDWDYLQFFGNQKLVEEAPTTSRDRLAMLETPPSGDLIFLRANPDPDGGGFRDPLFSFPHAITFGKSPTGMEFGYLGSGPAEAAINALYHLGMPVEWCVHPSLFQGFKERFIATLPQEEGGIVRRSDVLKWLFDEWSITFVPDSPGIEEASDAQ